MELSAKDLDLILALASETGVRMDQAAASRALLGRAIAAGLADRDLSAVAVFLSSDGSGEALANRSD